MIDRCENPKNAAFARYAGRGIGVCAKWRASFEAFLSDMGEAPSGLTLERLDNNAGYSPENCTWATYRAQARNTRRCRSLTHEGRTMLISDWAKEIGIRESSLRCRIGRLGWTVERALSTPKIGC